MGTLNNKALSSISVFSADKCLFYFLRLSVYCFVRSVVFAACSCGVIAISFFSESMVTAFFDLNTPILLSCKAAALLLCFGEIYVLTLLHCTTRLQASSWKQHMDWHAGISRMMLSCSSMLVLTNAQHLKKASSLAINATLVVH